MVAQLGAVFDRIFGRDDGDGLGDGQKYPDECYLTVYVDGTRRYDKAESLRAPPLGLSSFSLADLGAIEFYAGAATMPTQFQSKADCGVLLLWTRER